MKHSRTCGRRGAPAGPEPQFGQPTQARHRQTPGGGECARRPALRDAADPPARGNRCGRGARARRTRAPSGPPATRRRRGAPAATARSKCRCRGAGAPRVLTSRRASLYGPCARRPANRPEHAGRSQVGQAARPRRPARPSGRLWAACGRDTIGTPARVPPSLEFQFMCGICGMYAPGRVDRDVLQRMNDTIAHRGPDDEGFYTDDRVGLGSRRLSIIDLSAGHQPMSNEDETVWVVFNGEIYNFQELRRELEAQGHRFRTHTDTEVIVHLYEEVRRPACSSACAACSRSRIWDRKRGTLLLLARDRVGKKPLYYAWDGRTSGVRLRDQVPARLPGTAADASIATPSITISATCYVPDRRCRSTAKSRKLPAAHYAANCTRARSAARAYWDLRFDRPCTASRRARLRRAAARTAHRCGALPAGERRAARRLPFRRRRFGDGGRRS